ncbi:DUF1642 domain-containing protein [Streptococcus ictaluri]|uniref:Phage protein n=1 Tax=Streptococcus ictaluri 707-05 TaxID=764299 RepID=G5K0H2_9STRE|nr:DUF1642 domain-containing protein [Streptococcus ictaluri]EHI70649.1 hypothetical protein STRIC_0094 [Streptococcus ictaluri 707-05]
MNIEEAIKKIRELDLYGLSPAGSKKAIIPIVCQIKLDQSKPEVPKFVSDWIEEHKQMYGKRDEESKADFVFRAIYDIFRFGEGITTYDFSISDELSKWTTENAYKFITVILFGYTVEKEKLYIVDLPNGQPLVRGKNTLYFSQNLTTENARLTESEIRKDFEWAWREGFAKEVPE